MNRQQARRQIERSYQQALNRLMRQIQTAIGKATDPHKIVRRLRQIAERSEFEAYCNALAQRFTTELYYENARTWRQAAWGGSRGSEIYKAVLAELDNGRIGGVFAAKILDNAKYIKMLPRELAKEFTDYIQAESLRGKRAAEISRDLSSLFPEYSAKRIALIARTEASKTTTALTQARAQDLGLDWYVWRTSEDARVRSSHHIMDGVLVRWSDPPSPERLAGQKSYGNYHAGDIFNCRCYPEPVLRMEDILFPVKVYYGGAIQRMTKARFEQIA